MVLPKTIQKNVDKLGSDLADKWLMIMHNHGLLSAGRTVSEAFYFLYVLEIACKVQVDVMSTNAELIYPDQGSMDVLAGYNVPNIDQPKRCRYSFLERVNSYVGHSRSNLQNIDPNNTIKRDWPTDYTV